MTRGRSCPRTAGRARGRTVLLVIALALVAAPARAQDDDVVAPGRLVLTAVTPIVTADPLPATDDTETDETETDGRASEDTEALPTELVVRLAYTHVGSLDLVDARAVLELFPAVGTRSELWAALAEGTDLGRPLQTTDTLLPSLLASGEVGGAEVVLDATLGRRALGGVHPLRVSVVQGTSVLTAVTTAALVDPDPAGTVDTVLAIPLDGPSVRERASDPVVLPAVWAPGGRLQRLATQLARAATPVTVVLGAHQLEDLAAAEELEGTPGQRAAAARTTLRTALTDPGHDVVPSMYAGADLDALLAAGGPSATMAAELVSEGGRRLELLEPAVTIDPTTFITPASLSEAVLGVVSDEVVLLPPTRAGGEVGRTGRRLAAADPQPLTAEDADTIDTTDPRGSATAANGRVLAVLVGDPALGAVLGGDATAGAVPLAQRVLADLTLAASAPGAAVVVLPPLDWAPPPGIVDELTARTAAAPWVRSVAAAQLARPRTAASLPAVPLTSGTGSLDPGLARRVGAAAQELSGVVAANPDEANEVGGRDASALYDEVVRAASVWGVPGTTPEALVADVERLVDEAFGAVAVVVPPVTLTSSSGQIPVGLRRTGGGPLLVRVEVEASSGGLSWPAGRTQLVRLDEGAAANVPFDVEARSRGEFPVTVTVSDPNGLRVLATARVAVTSTAISRPALGTVLALVAVLLLVGRRRRRRRDTPGDGPHLTLLPPPDDDPSDAHAEAGSDDDRAEGTAPTGPRRPVGAASARHDDDAPRPGGAS